MIDINFWHLFVSLPSNQEAISFSWPVILFGFLSIKYFQQDLKSKEVNIYGIKLRRLRLQILDFLSFQFYCQTKSRFNWRGECFRKNCDSQGRTRWYWYRNFEYLLRVGFIHKEFGNLKGFVDVGGLTRNLNEKMKPSVL